MAIDNDVPLQAVVRLEEMSNFQEIAQEVADVDVVDLAVAVLVEADRGG